MKISKFWAYITFSLLYVAYCVQSSFETHRQFFPAVVALSMNKGFGIALANGMFAAYLLCTTLTFRFWFGKLQANDRRRLNEFIGMHIIDICVALSYFRDEVNSVFVMFIFINAAARIFHTMTTIQQDTMEQTGQASKRQVIKLTILLGLMFALDTLALAFFASKIMKEGLSVTLLLVLESVNMTLAATATLLKLLLNQIEAYKGKIWQAKGALKFYVELAHEFCASAAYVVFFGLSFKRQGQIPLHLIRELIFNFRRFSKTIAQFVRYQKMAAMVESKFPDASPEELEVDRVCAICYDEMENNTKAKKLPCGHCFHYHCLRRWVEKQTACPYCWAELDRKDAPQRQAAVGVPPAAPPAPQAEARQQQQNDEALLEAAYMAYVQMHAEAHKAQGEAKPNALEKQAQEKSETKSENVDEGAKADNLHGKLGENDETRPEPTNKGEHTDTTGTAPGVSPLVQPPGEKVSKTSTLPTAPPKTTVQGAVVGDEAEGSSKEEQSSEPVKSLRFKSKLFSQPSSPAATQPQSNAKSKDEVTPRTPTSVSPPPARPRVAPTAEENPWTRSGTNDSLGATSTASNMFDLEEIAAHQEYQDDIKKAQTRLESRINRLSQMRREASSTSRSWEVSSPK